MIIVGEMINASRKSIKPLITEKNSQGIKQIAKDQIDGGANFIDVNAGIFVDKEPEYIKWLVETVQEDFDMPCSLDSPNYKAIESALSVHKGKAMINSISLEKERYENLIPCIEGTNLNIIALCMDDNGMPETKDQRLTIADKLINQLVSKNIKKENIYVDPLVQPIATDDSYGIEFLNTLEAIRKEFPEVHTMCGLSNISYGVPKRKFVNRTFMVMAITKGLDGAIVNPTDKEMMASIIAAETLVGRDKYCENYLKSFRNGMFEF